MGHKFDPANRHLLFAEDRIERFDRYALLRSLGVGEGKVVADLGCGPGFFTLPASELVGPTGKVFAVDVQQEMVDDLRSRLAQQGITNVMVRRSSELEPSIPQRSVDLALLAFVLHEIDQRSSFLLAAKRLLRDDGRIAVLEWEKIETPTGPPLEVRVTADEIIADAAAAGLALEEQRSIHEWHYVLTFVPRS
ncbi:MAG TPA: methyltransferase domain-containing protein [Ktedonobacterales bacterium]|nr:methyltransferase domain-containing protein [Ktedonobacterales bacterium]